MRIHRTSPVTPQKQAVATIPEVFTFMVIWALVGTLALFALSMIPIRRGGSGGTSAFVPTADVLEAKVWINAETSGDRTYLQLNEEGSTPLVTYSKDDIQNVVLPLFEARRKVHVLSWSEDKKVSAKGKSYTRGLNLEHEPLR